MRAKDNALARLVNSMEARTARHTLMRCCASPRWTDAMLEARPFHDDATVLAEAERLWMSLEREDWLQAFAAHPRMGEDVQRLRARFNQPGAPGASESTLVALSIAHRSYFHRFGHAFVVEANGKSAVELLTSLRSRLRNDAASEVRVAAREQAKITRMRLARLAEEQSEAETGSGSGSGR
jgi:2-oxo-4-hydroxy-4-carboxy-5-ureidoimidazoline decarboxylase